MNKYDWDRLNHLQLGRYAEYYAKMEFTLFGFDVYSAEVDDHGIDFVIRKGENTHYDVQVKSARGLNYIFFHKDKFKLWKTLRACPTLRRISLALPDALFHVLATSGSAGTSISPDTPTSLRIAA